MTDPITLSILAVSSLAATAIGGGVQAFGAYEKGRDTQAMYNFQSRVAQINADIAKEQSAAETVSGGLKAETSGFRTGEQIGDTRARLAAGGLDLGSGSAKELVSTEAEIGDYEQATIRNDAARKAYGYNVAAFGDIAQRNLDVAAGQGARQAALFDTTTSILGGATATSDKWIKFQQEGIFTS